MKKIINWGIVSTAKIGWEYLIPAIHRSKNSKVIALASRNISKARSLSKKMKIPKCYGSYRELYQDPEIDIIYNPLTKSFTHQDKLRGLQLWKAHSARKTSCS
jgi:predicted dehydrogenase